MSILLFLIVSYILLSFSLYKVFPKAGVDATKGLIPGVNFVEWCKLIGRKPSHALWLLFPIVNIFIFCAMAVDLVRSFGKLRFRDTAGAVLYAPAAIGSIALDDNAKYVGPILIAEKAYQEEIAAAIQSKDKYKLQKLTAANPYKKAIWREWTESIFFAVFAASFIRMFLIEAYVIPTPSMEGSLNVGDFLFVSKAHYGIRTPMTIAMLPLVHNRAPLIGTESYLESPSFDYHRLPALQDVKRNRPFVFNWPVGDSIYLTSSRSYTVNQIKRNPDWLKYDRELNSKVNNKEVITRPLDKKDHYIKRCVAIAGDSLQVIDGSIYINGEKAVEPTHRQFSYEVLLPEGAGVNRKKLDELGIDYGDKIGSRGQVFANGRYDKLCLDSDQVAALESMYPAIQVKRIAQPKSENRLFPHDAAGFGDWTVDDYGPIYIPQKGATVTLTPQNIALYKRIIANYEKNDLQQKGDTFYINGEQTDTYTFKMNYYWAMGDNRHNSEDSRMWGYVPEDHIVGKPLFVFFSTKEGSLANGVNWDRVMMSANSGLRSDD